MEIHAQETIINRTENYRFHDSDWYETDADTPGEFFRMAQAEHGRCVSRVYVDGKDGEAVHVGWVFQKRAQYDDCAETFLQETWVTFRTAEPPPHCATCGTVHGTGKGIQLGNVH